MLSPTVILYRNFNVSEDAVTLRAAIKDTNEQAIIDILTARTNAQRQEIARYFLAEFGRDLVEDLKSELSGNFKDVIVALMYPPVSFLCEQLHRAMGGIYTKETTLVEILCTKTNAELKEIVKRYRILKHRPLVEHLCSKTSGSFGHLLTLIVSGVRDENGSIDPALAGKQDKKLCTVCGRKFYNDEEVFHCIMAHANFAQMRLIFDEYKKFAIKHGMNDGMADVMRVIVDSMQSKASFFASRLYKAMKVATTNDRTLIRIIVSRSEIDLNDIKREFQRMFNRTLLSAVKSATSGHYRRALCALIGDA